MPGINLVFESKIRQPSFQRNPPLSEKKDYFPENTEPEILRRIHQEIE